MTDYPRRRADATGDFPRAATSHTRTTPRHPARPFARHDVGEMAEEHAIRVHGRNGSAVDPSFWRTYESEKRRLHELLDHLERAESAAADAAADYARVLETDGGVA